jgi:hypothetical protein
MTCDGSVSESGWWIDDITVSTHPELCDAHACGVPGEVALSTVAKVGTDVELGWWDDPVCTQFRVWRSSDPTGAGQFSDVTAEDADPTDATFRDSSGGDLIYWIIEAVGPDGDGPWGHFGQ